MVAKNSDEVGLEMYNHHNILVGFWSFIRQPGQKVRNQYKTLTWFQLFKKVA